jgi:hypothetical protein
MGAHPEQHRGDGRRKPWFGRSPNVPCLRRWRAVSESEPVRPNDVISIWAAAVFCDPPYNVRARAIGGRGRVRHPEFAFASGEMRPAQYRRFLCETLGNGVQVSTQGAVHYVCIDWRHIADLIEVGEELFGGMLNLVVWNKTNAGQGSFYRSQHELMAFSVSAPVRTGTMSS